MFASFGIAKYSTCITFMSKAAIDLGVHKKLGLKKQVKPAHGTRQLSKKDMKLNAEMPKIDVDPQTYEVIVDGVLVTCEPAEVLPMAQRYFLF